MSQIRRERAEVQQLIQAERATAQQQINAERAITQQQIQDLRTEMRELGDRLERPLQVVVEQLNQQQQEIDELKSRRIVSSS